MRPLHLPPKPTISNARATPLGLPPSPTIGKTVCTKSLAIPHQLRFTIRPLLPPQIFPSITPILSKNFSAALFSSPTPNTFSILRCQVQRPCSVPAARAAIPFLFWASCARKATEQNAICNARSALTSGNFAASSAPVAAKPAKHYSPSTWPNNFLTSAWIPATPASTSSAPSTSPKTATSFLSSTTSQPCLFLCGPRSRAIPASNPTSSPPDPAAPSHPSATSTAINRQSFAHCSTTCSKGQCCK